MITHYHLTFKGYINRTFDFDVDESEIPYTLKYSDEFPKFQVREDGYLYINDCRITNNESGIKTIRFYMDDGNLGGGRHDTHVYNTYAIDSNGLVILEKHKSYQNKVDRFLDFLCG